MPPIKKNKLIPIVGGNNIDVLNAEELLRKQKMNTEELMKQQRELEAIEKKYKEFVGEQNITSSDGNSQGNMSGRDFGKKIENGRIITIKSNKYYDVKDGDIKK